MATEDRTQAVCTIAFDRLELVRSAADMLAAVAGPLQDLTSGTFNPRVDAAHQLAIRIEDLASALLTALNDESPESMPEAWDLYFGPELARQAKRDAAGG